MTDKTYRNIKVHKQIYKHPNLLKAVCIMNTCIYHGSEYK